MKKQWQQTGTLTHSATLYTPSMSSRAVRPPSHSHAPWVGRGCIMMVLVIRKGETSKQIN